MQLTREHFSVHADLVDGVRVGDDELRLGGEKAPDAATDKDRDKRSASMTEKTNHVEEQKGEGLTR